LEQAMLQTVDAVAKLTELRDPYTSGHEKRVGEISAAIAVEMGFDERYQEGLRGCCTILVKLVYLLKFLSSHQG
jgi:HD-GYP domain-containing protein (c-di-GMP phosphodiesterase class II)